jgi:hypothetical protein
MIAAKKPAGKPAVTSPNLDIATVLEKLRENIVKDTFACGSVHGKFTGTAVQPLVVCCR